MEIPKFASGFFRLIIDSNTGNKEETMNIRKNMDYTDMYKALNSATEKKLSQVELYYESLKCDIINKK